MIQHIPQSLHLDYQLLEDLSALSGPGEDMLGDLKDLFLSESRTQLAILARMLEAWDARAVSEVAHRLKGSALTMGASQLAKICSGIEDAAREGDRNRARADAPALATEFADVAAALDQMVMR
jgi:HPt (histidine-containing phosphotransfer) domain-containing protein